MDSEFEECIDELAEHPGQQLVWERDSLQRALQVFFHHTDRFERFLSDFPSQIDNGGQIPDRVNDEFVIVSHDYFSAAYSLFNKAQSFQSSWYCSCDDDVCHADTCEEFTPYFEQLVESGLTEMGAYINSIRVIVQKIQTPCLLNHTKYNFFDVQGGEIVIHRNTLLDWITEKRDRQPVIEYLQNKEDAYLNLLEEVESYRECIESFYGWLFKNVNQKYAHELRSRRKLLEQFEEEL